jgi:hypothetical protein
MRPPARARPRPRPDERNACATTPSRSVATPSSDCASTHLRRRVDEPWLCTSVRVCTARAAQFVIGGAHFVCVMVSRVDTLVDARTLNCATLTPDFVRAPADFECHSRRLACLIARRNRRKPVWTWKYRSLSTLMGTWLASTVYSAGVSGRNSAVCDDASLATP